ncbi:MAG: pyruvate carboxylase subunit B [Selenomonadaceae bacterium]|nr:pyruvate carboxylase subunit B [Selenomonadaceae bacterium]
MAKPLQIMETVLRDGHQSLCATRMRYRQMEPMLASLDKIGYKALEAWGGATFDTCLRFLDEDPWERLDKLKANLKTPIQMLLRGQNLLGYNHYSNDVVEKFVQHAAAHGIGVFRIFDALNDVRNLRVAIKAALACPEKPEVQGCLVYTISPVHTNEMFVELAKELQEMGCHSICIKDMSGLLAPYAADDLVRKLKAALDIPVELHTHCTSGFGHATYLKAIEAGVDIVDCALSPFSCDTSQPCTETIVAMLKGTERDTGLDRQAMTPIAKHFLGVKAELIKEFGLKGYFDVNVNVLDFQIPGGMLSNLANQLKEAGMEDKYQDLLDEMPRVRADAGYPPLVTPSSQIVGTMATFNVMTGQRYKMVPNEFKDLVRGKFGRTPVPIDRNFIINTLGIPADQIIEDCSVEDAKAETFAQFKDELINKGFLNPTDEDVLSYALFPQVAEEFFKKHYTQISAYKRQ